MNAMAWVVLAALSSSGVGPGFAPGFEGVLTQRLTLAQGSGEQRTFLSERGLRSEVELHLKEQTVRTAFVATAGSSRGYSLDDASRTFKEVALAADASSAGVPATREPPEVLLGRHCQHVQLKLADDVTADYWTTRENLGPRALELVQRAAQLPASIRMALHSANADGLVMKMVQRKGNQVLLSLEPVSFKAVALAPDVLEVPRGYQRAFSK